VLRMEEIQKSLSGYGYHLEIDFDLRRYM
jgi:hypothetical protein